MKRILSIMLIMSLVLAACGGNEESNKTETAKSENKSSDTPSFENDIAKLNDIDVTVKDSKVRPAGTTDAQTTDQLIIDYTVKNKSDKDINVITAWQAAFEATQDSKDAERKLQIGASPFDGKYKEMIERQLDNIKKGGTVEGVVAYDLEDTETPVKLTAHQGSGGKELGTKTIKLK